MSDKTAKPPYIYDNDQLCLANGLEQILQGSHKAHICAAYFNLHAWSAIAPFVEQYSGPPQSTCRLLLGMYGEQKRLHHELETNKPLKSRERKVKDKLKAKAKEHFKQQLQTGPYKGKKGLQKLKQHLEEKKLEVKLYTIRPLHAKLYMAFNNDNTPTAILGSSNFTYSGLKHHGELNIDVQNPQNCQQLEQWFDDKWNCRWNIDFSDTLLELLNQSWPSPNISPYQVYLKMLYHLKQQAQEGLNIFNVPTEFKKVLFPFQSAAVRIAAQYTNSKRGLLLGDVVGLGKTLTTLAVAKIFEKREGGKALILCPPNLINMWQTECDRFNINAKIKSLYSTDLPDTHYNVIIIDESHNLRNPQGQKYKKIKQYIKNQNDTYVHGTKCILLSATPYNKSCQDLSSQLSLFIDADKDLGIKPEKFLLSPKAQKFDKNPASLAAFSQSTDVHDWRCLMDQFLIRRTRSFIKSEYAKKDADGHYYIETPQKEKMYLPEREAKRVDFKLDDQYKQLYSEATVDTINQLELPRYGLINYKLPDLPQLSPAEKNLFKNLEKARSQPKGFCRVQLLKRLESSGYAFLKSLWQHILRNEVFLYAIAHKLPLPIGSLNGCTKEFFNDDADGEALDVDPIGPIAEDANSKGVQAEPLARVFSNLGVEQRQHLAQQLYEKNKKTSQIKFINSTYFNDKLKRDLEADTSLLLEVLQKASNWSPRNDLKLKRLADMITDAEAMEARSKKDKNLKKNLVFTQFKDTAEYLAKQLQQLGLTSVVAITGDTSGPELQKAVQRFSPKSNNYKGGDKELHTLIATDVLSEGQNLQDCGSVINYDIPWAIIKLVQRAGRVDRIGQTERQVYCHSFWPADGVEKLIRLRERVQHRLKQNQEILGSDERFFDSDQSEIQDLYHEKSQVLEERAQGFEDTDLSSYALSLWNKELKKDKSLNEVIAKVPDKVMATKKAQQKKGVLLFAQTNKNDHLLHIEAEGRVASSNARSVLELARCKPTEPNLPSDDNHCELVNQQLEQMKQDTKKIENQDAHMLGAGTPRYKLYHLIKCALDKLEMADQGVTPLEGTPPEGTPLEGGTQKERIEELKLLLDDVHNYKLTSESENTLIGLIKEKKSESKILSLVIEQHQQQKLIDRTQKTKLNAPPHIVCSLGLQ